jgi:hypothetical protein
MKKLIERIKAWFRKPAPLPGPEAGPIFRPIFRRKASGAKITEALDRR